MQYKFGMNVTVTQKGFYEGANGIIINQATASDAYVVQLIDASNLINPAARATFQVNELEPQKINVPSSSHWKRNA
jgi:hypothetical protein